jgi:FMN phosphatase YigB (HAD superfamily)
MAGRSNAGHAVLVDDSLVNLKAARAAGFSTVLRVGPGAVRPLAGAAYIDARVRSVRQLGRRLS